MPKQLSSLDMHFILKELKELEGSRADRIYNSGKEEIYIQLHKSNIGKKIIRILIGKAIFATDTKNIDETPSGFCMLLRKHLEGKFLESVKQLEPERILEFIFKSKDVIIILYAEFFGKGNIILCDENNKIIDSLIRHQFKDRSIFPKEQYKHPSMEYNMFKIKDDELANLLKNSKKDKIITSLATELGLGGVYSEEVCILSKIDKNTKPNEISEKQTKNIINSIKKLPNKKLNPKIIYENDEFTDVAPIDLEFYNDYKNKKLPSFSAALEEYFAHELKSIKKKESKYANKINELNRIIEEQKISLEGLKSKEEENRKKAEAIYHNYQLIKEILDEINKASKKYSWEEIKEKLKGHKIVKDVNLKDKTVVVDI
ncbi:NFACT family protein [Candidatus Woesearchaeota archaeon]|nr:NFACT family protein [Candidatus Woesearchaeota archaeon]